MNKPFPHRDRKYLSGKKTVWGAGGHYGTNDIRWKRYVYAWKAFNDLTYGPRHGRYQGFLENVKDQLITAGTMFPKCDHEYRKRYIPRMRKNQWYLDHNLPDLKCRWCPKLKRSEGNRYRRKSHRKWVGQRRKAAGIDDCYGFEDSEIRAIREFSETYRGISGVGLCLALEYKTSPKVISRIVNNLDYASVKGRNE